MDVTFYLNHQPRVLKGADSGLIPADLGKPYSGPAYFFADTLLIYVLSDPAIGVAEQLPRCIDVNAFLSEHGCQTIPEAVTSDSFGAPNPLHRRLDRTFGNRVR